MKNNNTNTEMSMADFNQLWKAVYNNNIKEIASLMEEGACPDGITPLHMAAQEGHLDIVRYLVERGADFNQADKWGQTPLHAAAYNGHIEVVRYLIEGKGADFNLADRWNQTPLHLAACYGHTEVVRYLIERGADFNQVDNEGETPLHLAVLFGRIDVVRILLANGDLIPENISFNENVNQELQNEINRMLNSKRAEPAGQLVSAKGSRFFPDMPARRPRETGDIHLQAGPGIVEGGGAGGSTLHRAAHLHVRSAAGEEGLRELQLPVLPAAGGRGSSVREGRDSGN